MDILESIKRKIADFLSVRKRQSLIIEESAGPFRYEYISIYQVLGAKLPDGSPGPLPVAHLPEMNATAYVAQDWDEQYFHIDRANSVATLLLTGLVGIKRFKKLSRILDWVFQWIFGSEWVFMRNLEAQEKRIREQRLKDHSGSGCCLVYRAGGKVDQPLNLRASRKFSELGVALDAFDGS